MHFVIGQSDYFRFVLVSIDHFRILSVGLQLQSWTKVLGTLK